MIFFDRYVFEKAHATRVRPMSLFKDYNPDESQDLLHYYQLHCHSGEGQNLLPFK
jgi:hypothetical protein